MCEKFALPAELIKPATLARLEWRLPRGDISAYAWPQALVASIDFVKTGRQKDALLAHTLDLVIVDEAHGAARPPGGRGGRGQQLRHEFLCELATRLPRRLVQVAIWTEGQEPGRPLSFLDHHVRCGDALMGVLDLAPVARGSLTRLTSRSPGTTRQSAAT